MPPVYYPISALLRDHYPVFFPIQGLRLKTGELIQGTEVVGFRKTYRKGQANERVVFRVRRPEDPTRSEDLPHYLYPTLFRPISLTKYPDALPEPAALSHDVVWGSAHPEHVPADDAAPLDWIGPYNMPGSISRQEAEVRVLRALKTEASRGVDDGGLGGPKAYGSVLDAAMGGAITAAPWVPDKRDVGDWVTALGWLNRIEHVSRYVIRLKGMDYSFRQIAERYVKHLKRERVREKYHEGFDEVTKVANGGKP